MDEYDEINLGVVSTSYEIERERLNERPETARPATGRGATGKSSKIGYGALLLLIFAGMLFLTAIAELVRFFFDR